MTELVSPKGKILFMALNRPVKNKYSGKEEYCLRLGVDGTTAEGKAFRTALKEVNSKLTGEPSEQMNLPKGYFVVNAKSTINPEKPDTKYFTVYDADNTKVTDLPYFTKGSTGEAVISLKVIEGKDAKTENAVRLSRVCILDLDIAPSEHQENEVNFLEAINKIKKS